MRFVPQPRWTRFRTLKTVFLDCGTRDEFNLRWGTRMVARDLAGRRRGRWSHEEFEDGHSGTNYRFDRSLGLLVPRLAAGLKGGDPCQIDTYGLSRVVGETGVLPQRARKLDPALPLREAELLIDVESLNIDAASFKQIKDAAGGEPEQHGAAIHAIVARARARCRTPSPARAGC